MPNQRQSAVRPNQATRPVAVNFLLVSPFRQLRTSIYRTRLAPIGNGLAHIMQSQSHNTLANPSSFSQSSDNQSPGKLTHTLPHSSRHTDDTSPSIGYPTLYLTVVKTRLAPIGRRLAQVVPIGDKPNVNPTPIGGQFRK